MQSFPESARIEVPPSLATDLLRVTEKLPLYENKAFYDLFLQETVYDTIRAGCLDGFDWLIREIRTRLKIAPFSVLINGLKFDGGNRLFVALNRAFGDLVARPYKKPRAQLVHYIQPATDIKLAKGVHTENEQLHTDCADWPELNALISMVCVRPDRHGGGHSRILHILDLREEICECFGPDMIRRLEQELVPWRMADYLGGSVVWRPILSQDSLCWRRSLIDSALENADIELSEQMVETLNAVEQIIRQTNRMIDFLMEAGEFLIMDNKRCIHARTPISGPLETSNRLMLRSWIRAPEQQASSKRARKASWV